ncbi:MAG TPA: carbamoyltransferase HypF, partial [Gemmatimonadaceae bacterium]|nr:carbamoyltransferase HypF [Gemmatimonadaceae bacterium]
MANACSVRVRGVVQGVGFRPFVYRIARENSLAGWVLNAGDGVEIHVEGSEGSVDLFLRELFADAPAASSITAIDVAPAEHTGAQDFSIRASPSVASPTTRISPDLPVCPRCLAELADPGDPRFGYPYINCTDCGPRYSIIEKLPYDRANTTMAAWPMDERCAEEYADATSRRFHAQPIACPTCGPHYLLETGGEVVRGDARAIERAAALLRDGEIVAIKGLGGYHLACDARRGSAVQALRERKFRKEKPFALMVRSLEVARELADLSPNAELLLTSQARPIVLARARVTLPGVAPDNGELGLMLPYTPLHHMLFSAGAPEALVMTSANRSSEPIAYEDDDAREHLTGIADAFLVGERPIARRVEDSVARVGLWGPVILRRSRGYAPGAVAALPTSRPLLAVGADLKNAITLVVDGQAFVSQHIGDLESWDALRAWQETIRDLLSMYQVRADELLVVHDAHPEYRSTAHANELGARAHLAVQHHRAHIASVLAEHALLEERVVGVSFDGTGYGVDGTIWGGEVFVGSVAGGFERVAHLRQADLVG